VRDAGGEQAHRRHLLRVLQLLLEPHARGDVVEDQDRPAALAGSRLERRHREVHHLAAAVGRGQVQLVDVGDLVVVAQHERAAQGIQESLGEDGVELLPEHLGPGAAIEPLHRTVPAHHLALEVEHHDPRVEAFQDVLVVVLEPAQLVRFLGEAAVQPPVHDRGGRLRRERLERVDFLAVERVEPVLAAHAENGDHLALHAAREEPGEPGGGELGSVDRGLVDVDRLSGREPLQQRCADPDPRTALAGAGHAVAAERDQVAAGVGQQQRHLAQPQRRADPLEQPLRGPLEVEVRVQVLGQPHERLARAVAFLVEEPVEHFLDAYLHGREREHHDHRAQERDQRGVRLFPEHVCDADRQQREPDDHSHRQHVAERAAEQQLYVHQPMLHHRVGERERDERERPVAGELESETRVASEREGQGVERQEREDTGRGAPQQPLDLAPRHEPARAPVGIDEDGDREREVRSEVERLRAVDRLDDGPESALLLPGGEQGVAHRPGPGHHQRRQVERRDQPGPRGARAALGEGEAEVQEHGRQEQHRQRVDPEQHPVEERERARVGGGVGEEEESADGVEMQRRAVRRSAQQHDGADHETEEAGE
jgi:hypothetical protein